MQRTNLALALLSALSLFACSPGASPPVDGGPLPGGGAGIPYAHCNASNVSTQCTPTTLSATGIDPKGDLKAVATCEFPPGQVNGWCRAYYVTGKVCLHNDTIICAKGAAGNTGTATCNDGNWGDCI